MARYSRHANGHKANHQFRQRNTAHTHSNEGTSNQQMTAQTEQKTTQRRRNTDPMQLLNAQILRKFKNLPADLQSTETKLSCINAVLAAHKEKCGDPARYYGWLLSRAAEVKRTFDFATVCENAGLTVAEQQAVAEHLVLEGKAICNNIRLNGLVTYDGNIRMFRQRLVPTQFLYEAEAKEGSNA